MAQDHRSRWSTGTRCFVAMVWRALWLWRAEMLVVVLLTAMYGLVSFKLACDYHWLIWPYENAQRCGNGKLAQELGWDAIAAFAGFVLAAAAISSGLGGRTRQEQFETYQRLELSSIELFRWEIDHMKVVESFWTRRASSHESFEYGAEGAYAQKEYGCQVLNLFEMAVRTYKLRAMPDDVLASWAAWIWEFSGADLFIDFWDKHRIHYIRELQYIINKAISIRNNINCDRMAEIEFYYAMAYKLGSWETLKIGRQLAIKNAEESIS